MNDHASVTRAIEFLPSKDREKFRPALVAETHEDGAYPKFEDLKTVGAVRTAGAARLTEIGINAADANWLLAQWGGAKRGPKPKGK